MKCVHLKQYCLEGILEKENSATTKGCHAESAFLSLNPLIFLTGWKCGEGADGRDRQASLGGDGQLQRLYDAHRGVC